MTEDDPRAAAIACYLLLNQNGPRYRQLVAGTKRAAAWLSGQHRAGLDEGLLARLQAWPHGRAVSAQYRQWQQALAWLSVPGRSLWLADRDPVPAAFQAAVADDGPPLLFLSGALAALDLPQVALVGSRSASPYGLGVARDLARGLAQQGLAVTSGLASGIDAAAHAGALAAGGTTLAVLGNGPDRCYPPANRQLQDSVVANGGLLVSEFVPGTGPQRHHFPRRNAVIARLALGVAVIEAGEQSGSLITAAAADALGRAVMAVPGPIHSRPSSGCHQLIRDGLAVLVSSAEEVLMSVSGPLLTWYGQAPACIGLTHTEPGPAAVAAADAPVLAAMGWEAVTVDMLIQRLSTWPPGQVLASLGRLELAGVVSVSAGCYARQPP